MLSKKALHRTAGLSAEQILEGMRDLEMEDMNAALTYAARKLDRPVLVV